MTVKAGGQAVYQVTVNRLGTFKGSVTISVSGAPGGSVVTVTPIPRGNVVPVRVSIQTAASTPAGTYPIKITGYNGTVRHTVTVQLVITRPPGLVIALAPPTATVIGGESTTYTLSITRGLVTGPLDVKVTGLPADAIATITPSSPILGNTATIKVTTGTDIVPGTYTLTVKVTGAKGSATTTAVLIVQPATSAPFAIFGSADRVLLPGGESGAINLALHNPFNAPMTVTLLGVTVVGTNKVGCGTNNYSVTAYGGSYPLTIPANSTRTLQQLGVARASWPQVQMLNLPVSQDVCKGATVQLSYSGAGGGA